MRIWCLRVSRDGSVTHGSFRIDGGGHVLERCGDFTPVPRVTKWGAVTFESGMSMSFGTWVDTGSARWFVTDDLACFEEHLRLVQVSSA